MAYCIAVVTIGGHKKRWDPLSHHAHSNMPTTKSSSVAYRILNLGENGCKKLLAPPYFSLCLWYFYKRLVLKGIVQPYTVDE